MKKIILLVAVICVCGCGGGGSSSSSTTTGTTVSGKLYQPNGTDPLPGALLYIPKAGGTSISLPASKSTTVGTDCEAVPSGVEAAYSTCTEGDGDFSLNITDCSNITATGGTYAITYKKGAIQGTLTVTFTCTSEAQTVAVTSTETTTHEASAGNLKIAVCSGRWDKMENVLARMGYAPSDTDDDGTSDFDNWDRSVDDNFNFFRSNGDYSSDNLFPSCCDLLQGDTVAITDSSGSAVLDSNGTAISRAITDYDIVFMNCGSGCESGGLATVLEDVLSSSSSVLRSYVNGGGALYVTDLSYDFVEQAFPEYVDFFLGGHGSTAETEQSAQTGLYGTSVFEPLASTVNQTTLQSYLASVTSANTDCGTPTGTGSLNSDNSVNICDFLSSWAVMTGLESASTATNWIRGKAQFSGDDTDVNGNVITSGTTEIPLTISFQHGSGSVLYSSYHTNNSSLATTEFLPQERILQFLILQILGSI